MREVPYFFRAGQGRRAILFTIDKYNSFKINVNDIFIYGKDYLSKMKERALSWLDLALLGGDGTSP